MITVKLKRALILTLSLSLLGNQISGCASGAASRPELTTYDWELPIAKGTAAPYSGILVPEDAYRFYQADSIAYPECKDKLKDAVVACASGSDEGWLTGRQLFFGVLGLTLGLFISPEGQWQRK